MKIHSKSIVNEPKKNVKVILAHNLLPPKKLLFNLNRQNHNCNDYALALSQQRSQNDLKE